MERLKKWVADGAVDTVIVAGVDLQGRLYGKRCAAGPFLRDMAEGIHTCDCNFGWDVERMLIPGLEFTAHFHNTRAMGLVNTVAAVEAGIRRLDMSLGGIGGCPYAPGASGNVATEDVLYLLHGLGIDTGVDLDMVVDAGQFICKILGKLPQSKVALATLAKRPPIEVHGA
jgi:hypothetical protein